MSASKAVGLPTRCVASAIDAVLPTVGLFMMIRIDILQLTFLEPEPGFFLIDIVLKRFFEQPWQFLRLPLTWMLVWSGLALVGYGTVRSSLGKWIVGLTIRQNNGQIASGWRLLFRVFWSWLPALTLGLAYLWIVVSPQRRGWHDVLSGTLVVRDERPKATPVKRGHRHRFEPE